MHLLQRELSFSPLHTRAQHAMDSKVFYPVSRVLAIVAEAFPGKVVVAADNAILIMEEKTTTFESPVTVYKLFEKLDAEYLTIDSVTHVKVNTEFKYKPCACETCLGGVSCCTDCSLSVQLE